jgi:hypothetical protein
MQHGRPGRSTQIQMQQKLRKYYNLGVSATVTAQETGINIKTVSKYFDEWTEQIMENYSTNFLEDQKKERVRIINAFDLIIINISDILDEMNQAAARLVKQNKSSDHLYPTRLRAMQFLAEMVEKRSAITLKPQITDSIRSEIEEMLNNAKNRQNN